MMKLTTPEQKELDPAFPGENWFYYWKTAASLWESKLLQIPGASPVYVPINWGFHMDFQHTIDFGEHKPETDLKRLFDVAQKIGRKLIFIMPLTPAPFLTNGGVPSYLARVPALNQYGLIHAIIDNENHINRLYSFFDPRIFQGYRKFVGSLGSYFSTQGLGSHVYCGQMGYIDQEKFHPFIEDGSIAFEQGFKRYCEQNQILSFATLAEENAAKENYSDQVKSLYEVASKEALGGHYAGIVKISFVGAEPEELIERSHENFEHKEKYLSDMMHVLTSDVIPSTVLLGDNIRKGLFQRASQKVLSDNFLKNKYHAEIFEDDLDLAFLPLSFFDVYKLDAKFSDHSFLSELGLLPFLNRNFYWTYRIHQDIPEEIPSSTHTQLSFFFGRFLDKASFNFALKLFMAGEKIFLDTSGLSQELSRKLELFLSENNLKTEKVNFLIPVTKAALGEGMLFLYSRDELINQTLGKRISFFETLVNFLKIAHLKVTGDEGLVHFWECRNSSTFELNYQEIRRLNLFNPSSYRKKANIHSMKNFAFLKIIDQSLSQVKSTPFGVEIEIQPGGSVSLDFGYFE